MAKHKPRISVVLATKDRPLLLQRCLTGISSQTFKNFELVVINDGGEAIDKAGKIFKQLAKESGHSVAVINNSRNLGSAAARNQGVKVAKGDIIAFIDDDAVPEPDWLGQIETYFNANLSVAAMNGCIQAISLDTSSERLRQAYYDFRAEILAGSVSNSYNFASGLIIADWLSLGNCAVRRGAIGYDLPPFNQDQKLNYGHRLAIRMLSAGQPVTYFAGAVIRHDHGRSLSSLFSTRLTKAVDFAQLAHDSGSPLLRDWGAFKTYCGHMFFDSDLLNRDKLLELLLTLEFSFVYMYRRFALMLFNNRVEKEVI